MKLNFWQWVGLIIFVIALAVVIWRQMTPKNHATEPATPPPAVVLPH